MAYRRVANGGQFPDAHALSRADLSAIGVLGDRARERLECTGACMRKARVLDSRASLLALPGVGAWTAEYVMMRAGREPDAFPSSDLVLSRAMGGASPKELLRRAEAWRPWRAYVAVRLWTQRGKAG